MMLDESLTLFVPERRKEVTQKRPESKSMIQNLSSSLHHTTTIINKFISTHKNSIIVG